MMRLMSLARLYPIMNQTPDPGLICHSAVFSLHLISLSHTTVHWLIFGVAADDSFRGLG
jgi:hypothetical protein